jgi:hypothetical protein
VCTDLTLRMSGMVAESGVAALDGPPSISEVTRRLEEQRSAFDTLRSSLNSLRDRLTSK